ncbi:hypothetical protein ZHAS_00021249 [Anopheles sinensis]|uniref:Uncharacterized protein n=1 Tax=Anopheles sinensis TaxID=74873 RepID=A0A084WS59_ANOSI|nr:hypothetical protein ZHAS_00021249 [Anopheles sinensis]
MSQTLRTDCQPSERAPSRELRRGLGTFPAREGDKGPGAVPAITYCYASTTKRASQRGVERSRRKPPKLESGALESLPRSLALLDPIDGTLIKSDRKYRAEYTLPVLDVIRWGACINTFSIDDRSYNRPLPPGDA